MGNPVPILLTREVKTRCAAGCGSEVHPDLSSMKLPSPDDPSSFLLYCSLCGSERALEIVCDPSSDIHSLNIAEAALKARPFKWEGT